MRYCIFDPTGNITALATDPANPIDQPRIATRIMNRHPEVEQVGFVRRLGASSPEPRVDIDLRMAGGEFCGNATMCAAVYHALRQATCPSHVCLSVSGATEPVVVRLRKKDDDVFGACVFMPPVLDVKAVRLAHGKAYDTLPVVFLEGISHVVIGSDSPLFAFLQRRESAEDAVRIWCEQLDTEGLGAMFLERKSDAFQLTPLVYVPASKTMYWENSCASGSAAVGMYLGMQSHEPIDITLIEPGGNMRVEADPHTGSIELHGHVKPLGSHSL